MREKESKEPAFCIQDRGFQVTASYLKDTDCSKGDALIEIEREGKKIREFEFPAYKIWNIAAHFKDIVDGELENSDVGYREAAWNGITPMGSPQPLEKGPSHDQP